MENNINNQDIQYGDQYGDQYGEYAVSGYKILSWKDLIGLEEPPKPTQHNEPFSGISSFLAKANIYFSTRNYFLQYLQFYSSYNTTYRQLYNEYSRIMGVTEELVNDVYNLTDMKTIEKEYQNIIKKSFAEIKNSSFKEHLYPIYLTFFKNVEYFKDFAKGYSFCFDGKYYANIIGNKYTILGDTGKLNCVEFDQDENAKKNFRMYPFIPLDVNPDKPIIELAIFGNNKWISPIEFILPYKNPDKPNYYYSINSIKISNTIEELKRPSFELDVKMEYKYYYHNKNFYPASDLPVTKKIQLFWENGSEPMIGVPFFVAGMEWIEPR